MGTIGKGWLTYGVRTRLSVGLWSQELKSPFQLKSQNNKMEQNVLNFPVEALKNTRAVWARRWNVASFSITLVQAYGRSHLVLTSGYECLSLLFVCLSDPLRNNRGWLTGWHLRRHWRKCPQKVKYSVCIYPTGARQVCHWLSVCTTCCRQVPNITTSKY